MLWVPVPASFTSCSPKWSPVALSEMKSWTWHSFTLPVLSWRQAGKPFTSKKLLLSTAGEKHQRSSLYSAHYLDPVSLWNESKTQQSSVPATLNYTDLIFVSSFLNSIAFVQFIAFPTITCVEKKSQHRHFVAGNRSILQKSKCNMAALLSDPII